jgi:RimJ/RimL family protein N-acetyltransferase
MDLSLRPVKASEYALVRDVQVEPDQVRYSGTVAQAFKEQEEGVDFHAILDSGQVVGFFKIDRLYHQQYSFARADELGLRAFMIDRERQGMGYATAAVTLLRAYLPRRYPGRSAVVLTVNMQNLAAVRCYRRGGFADTGGIHPHGIAGPQHILRMELGAAAES